MSLLQILYSYCGSEMNLGKAVNPSTKAFFTYTVGLLVNQCCSKLPSGCATSYLNFVNNRHGTRNLQNIWEGGHGAKRGRATRTIQKTPVELAKMSFSQLAVSTICSSVTSSSACLQKTFGRSGRPAHVSGENATLSCAFCSSEHKCGSRSFAIQDIFIL